MDLMLDFFKIYFLAHVQIVTDLLHITSRKQRDVIFDFYKTDSYFSQVFHTDFFKYRRLENIVPLNKKAKIIFNELKEKINNSMKKDAFSAEIFDSFLLSCQIYISNIVNNFLEKNNYLLESPNILNVLYSIMHHYNIDSIYSKSICENCKYIVKKFDNLETFGKYSAYAHKDLLTIVESLKLVLEFIKENPDSINESITNSSSVLEALYTAMSYQSAQNLFEIETMPNTEMSKEIKIGFEFDLIAHKLISIANFCLKKIKNKHNIEAFNNRLKEKIKTSKIFNDRICYALDILTYVYISQRNITQKIKDFFIRDYHHDFIEKQLNIINMEKIANSVLEHRTLEEQYKRFHIKASYDLSMIEKKLSSKDNNQISPEVLEKAKNIFLGLDEDDDDNSESNNPFNFNNFNFGDFNFDNDSENDDESTDDVGRLLGSENNDDIESILNFDPLTDINDDDEFNFDFDIDEEFSDNKKSKIKSDE